MGSKTKVCLIPYSPEIIDGEPTYFSSNCLPIKAFKLEPAGHAFHLAALKLIGHLEEKSKKSNEENAQSEKTNSHKSSPDSSKDKKKFSERKDHYAILGLAHLKYQATEEQIKKGYREAALKHHPDKKAPLLLAEVNDIEKQKKKDEIDDRFRAIQKAYEVLIDPLKRRLYDSRIDCDKSDEEIPCYCSRDDFFKVFGPVFLRNSRWSIDQPVPPLGDENSPIEEVDKFYDFWYNFKSRREFSHDDEFDLESAESREERRWMERQNAKLKEGARKEEYVRIRTLVNNAYKYDPRIIERKEKDKIEKKKQKEAKFMAKRLEEEEAKQVAEEERLKKEEEQRVAAEMASQNKKIREKEKKLLRKERSRLRTISAPLIAEKMTNISLGDVEDLCISLDINKLKVLCDNLEGKGMPDQAKFIQEVILCKDILENQNQDEILKENGFTKSSANGSEKICTNNGFDHDTSTKMDNGEGSSKGNGDISRRDQSEKSVFVKENGAPISNLNEEKWSEIQERAFAQALRNFPKNSSQRWERVAAAVPGKSANQCKKRFLMMDKTFNRKKAG